MPNTVENRGFVAGAHSKKSAEGFSAEDVLGFVFLCDVSEWVSEWVSEQGL